MKLGMRILAAAVVLAAFATLVARTNFLIDDAFISFRYAMFWSESGIPAFHPEATPVEGYSNFLWVVLLRWMHSAGFSLELASRVVSIALATATLGLVARYLRRSLALQAHVVFLATLLLATFPPFVVWSTGGLESALHGLLLAWATTLFLGPLRSASPGAAPEGADPVEEREGRAGLLAGLAGAGLVLVRAEGFAWAGLVLFAGIVARKLAGARLARRSLTYFGTVSGVLIAFLLWRHAVYGEWVANTVHAKYGHSLELVARGLRTIATFALLFATPLLAVLAPLWARRGDRSSAWGIWLVFAGALAFNVIVGGDWMPFFRLLAPASALLAMLVALFLARLPRVAAWSVCLPLVVFQVLPVFQVNVFPRAVREALYFRTFLIGYQTEWQRWERGEVNRVEYTRIGKALARVAGPEDSLVLGPIGAIGYFSRMQLHDRNGLVDAEVARRDVELGAGTAGHEKRVPRLWFLPREPTYFEAWIWSSGPAGPAWPGMEGAVRATAGMIREVMHEGGLFDHSVVQVHEIGPDDEFPEPTYLVLLRREPDPAVARAFWTSFGVRRAAWGAAPARD